MGQGRGLAPVTPTVGSSAPAAPSAAAPLSGPFPAAGTEPMLKSLNFHKKSEGCVLEQKI